MDANAITSAVINAAIDVHRELGPGLLESVYERAMIVELAERNLAVSAQVPVSIVYKGNVIHDQGLALDLLVADTVVVELKSVDVLKDVHKKQLLTYLRLAGKPVGLLLNFNEPFLKDGIVRIVNQYDGALPSRTGPSAVREEAPISAFSAPPREIRSVAVHEDEMTKDPATGRGIGFLINEAQGAVKGFCMGLAYYPLEAYGEPGVHDDQEGFYVLEGTGTARIGDAEFRIRPGSAFLAAAGVPHTMKRDADSVRIKVLWAHGAVT